MTNVATASANGKAEGVTTSEIIPITGFDDQFAQRVVNCEPTTLEGIADILSRPGGGLDRVSWTLSQSFYFGSVTGKPPIRVELVEGECIDLAAAWLPDPIPSPTRSKTRVTTPDNDDEPHISAPRDDKPISVEQL